MNAVILGLGGVITTQYSGFCGMNYLVVETTALLNVLALCNKIISEYRMYHDD